MRFRRSHIRSLVVGPVAALAAFLPIATATAAPAQVTQFDVSGTVFACGDESYTVAEGEFATLAVREEFSEDGTVHVTGTASPGNTELLGSDGEVYYLAGSNGIHGQFTAGGAATITSPQFYTIRAESGGVVATVTLLLHVTQLPDGSFTAEFETNTECTIT
jgi:hypothetical protein